jgi:hypothetical protein
MERKNKASLSQNLLFSVRKGRNFEETRRAWACLFFLGINLCLRNEKALPLLANYNNKHFNAMNTITCNPFLFTPSNTFILIIIERDDGKKEQTLAN